MKLQRYNDIIEIQWDFRDMMRLQRYNEITEI